MSILRTLRTLLASAGLGALIVYPALADEDALRRLLPDAAYGDFDGDKVSEALVQPSARSEGFIAAPRENGASFSRRQNLPSNHMGLDWSAETAQVLVGDFDGDGRDDVHLQPLSASRTQSVVLSNEAGLLVREGDRFPSNYMGFDWSAATTQLAAGDFDGDGRDDVLLQNRFGESGHATVLSGESGYEIGAQTWRDGYLGRQWNAYSTEIYTGDFNGDGREDLLMQVVDDTLLLPPHSEAAYAMLLADEGGLFTRVHTTWERDELGEDWDPRNSELRIADYDGDGIADIALIARHPGGSSALTLGTPQGVFQSVTARWRGNATPREVLRDSGRDFTAATHAAAGEMYAETEETAEAGRSLALSQSSFASGNPAVGAIAGSASVSGGAASYSIPIVIPPGRRGMQPSVSINYSSRGGNGELGMGWSLGAGSSITRCPQTVEQDGFSKGVSFTGTSNMSEDRLCLDGQRLIVVSNDGYGESGATYRTESDSFVRVNQNAALTQGNARFTVYHEDGSKHYYGFGTHARLIAINQSGASQGLTHTWLLERSEDAAGNSIIYTYNESVAGERSLSTITYTGRTTTPGDRKVEFIWESRLDNSESWLAGFKTRQTRRLQMIKTWVGARQVREYRFSYAPSAATGRSLLSNVEECAYSESSQTRYCLPETNFDWYADGAALATPSVEFGGAEFTTGKARRVDVDGQVDGHAQPMAFDSETGDGFTTDFRLRSGSSFIGRGTRQVWWQGQAGPRMVKLRNDEQPASVGSDWPTLPPHLQPDWFHNDTEIDVNNDGRVDMVTTNGANIAFKVARWQSDSQVTFGTVNTNLIHADKRFLKLGDFTGDGKVDIIAIKMVTASDRRIVLFRNTSPSVDIPDDTTMQFDAVGLELHDPGETEMTVGSATYWDGAQLMEVMDLNGDGLLDVTFSISEEKPKESRLLRNASTATTADFTTVAFSVLGIPDADLTKLNRWADVNGDGLQDWIVRGTGGTWNVRINKGGTFTNLYDSTLGDLISCTPEECGAAPGPAAAAAVRAADIDNDGRMELLVPDVRLATACMRDITYQDWEGEWTTKTLCGNGLRKVDGLEVYDSSIYRFVAIRFRETATNGYVGEVVPGFSLVAPGTGFEVQDVNGDGLNDLIWAVNRLNTKQVYQTGCGAGCSLQFPSYGIYASLASHGNGVPAGMKRPPDTLWGVTDGLGRRSEWDFQPLTEDDTTVTHGIKVYNLPSNKGYEDARHFYFTSTMYVVNRMRQSNGLGGLLPTDYAYEEAVYNNGGRGFQGFRVVTQRDPQRGITRTTTFDQKFPLAGRVLSETVQIDGVGDPTSSVTNQWSAITPVGLPAGTRVRVPVLELSTRTSRDPRDSSYLSTTVEDPDYTPDGCVKSTSSTTTDPFGTYTQSSTFTITGTSGANSTWRCKLGNRTDTSSVIYLAKHGQAQSNSSSTLYTEYGYHNAFQGFIATETTNTSAGADATLRRIKTNVYNTAAQSSPLRGNLIEVKLNGGTGTTQIAERKTVTTYTSDGYFPFTVTNPEGHVSTITTDAAHGQPTQVSDPNGVNSYRQYDPFGRQSAAYTATLPVLTTDYQSCGSPCDGVVNTEYRVVNTQPGSPTQTVYYDMLNRSVASSSQSLDGGLVWQRKVFDPLGRVTQSSEPYLGGQPVHWNTTSAFDELDRPTATLDAKGLAVTYTYSGPTVQSTAMADGVTQTTRSEKNALGQLLTTIDAANGKTHFRYDAMGNPVRIVDAIGAVVTTTYNLIGQKTALSDPDMGNWTYGYNVAGELLTQTDANSKVTTFTYDRLGRMKTRSEPEGGTCLTTWTYDTATYGIGKLATAAQCDGYVETYSYDALGRVFNVGTTIAGVTHDTTTTYDASGRVDTVAYPDPYAGLPTTPDPVTNVQATPTTSYDGVVNLSWALSSTGITRTAVRVTRSLNGVVKGTEDLDKDATSKMFNLVEEGGWQFAISACNGESCSTPVLSIIVTVERTPFPATQFSVSPATSTDGLVTLTWSNPTTGPARDKIRVWRKFDGNPWQTEDLAASAQSKQYGPLANGAWSFGVAPCLGEDCAEPTSGNSTVNKPPQDPPTNVHVTPALPTVSTNGRLRLFWENPAGESNYTFFRVRDRIQGGSMLEERWVDLAPPGTEAPYEQVYDYDANGTYLFEVAACNNQFQCAVASDVSGTVQIPVASQPPNAPTNVGAAPWSSGSSTIYVTWGAPSGGPASTYYKAYQRPEGSGSWNTSPDLGLSPTAYYFTGLANGIHEVRVEACNGDGCTSSGVVTTTVNVPPPSPPGPPSNVSVDPTFSFDGNVTVYWFAPTSGGTPTTYRVHRRKNGGGWSIDELDFGNFQKNYPSLFPGSWEFFVEACNGLGCAASAVLNAFVDSGGLMLQGTEPNATSRAQGQEQLSMMQSAQSALPRFTVKHTYTATGYLQSVQDASTDALIWQANALNAYGQVALETYGNGLTTSRTLQPGTPFVSGISTGSSAGVQQLGYTWSAFGHLENRSDGNQGLSETFTYDLLNRVETATLTVSGSGPVTTFDVDYDAVGNITQKMGVGGYTYHATKRHAVVQAGGTSYTYDGNGNQLTRGGITQTWTVANLPKTLAGNGYTADFKYGPSRARYEQVATYSGRTETTLTVGGFERLIRSDRVGAEVRYRVSAGGIPVAEVKDLTASHSRSISYLHRDHLDSVDTVTDESGAIVARMSFDVHGNRRAATGAGAAWQAGLKYPTGTAAIDALRDKTPRGYTDHEMLDNVGLVHMNGRVYDPVIGRFLSVDPVFQFPENTQSLNPYTYVLNSPLSATDPTGFVGVPTADPTDDQKASGGMGVAGGQKVSSVTIDGQSIGVSSKKGTTKRTGSDAQSTSTGSSNQANGKDSTQDASIKDNTELPSDLKGVSTRNASPGTIALGSNAQEPSASGDSVFDNPAVNGSGQIGRTGVTPIDQELVDAGKALGGLVGAVGTGAGIRAVLAGIADVLLSALPGPRMGSRSAGTGDLRAVPSSLQDEMTLKAAQQGAGERIKQNLRDPKFRGMEKWRYATKSNEGLDSVVHYVRDPQTGALMDFKFKKQTTDL